MNLTTVHNSFTICFLFINIFINLTLPENLTAVLITFERSCIFVGETSMNIQWKGSDESPFLRVYILSFLSFSFFFQHMIWRLNLASQYYRPLSSGSQKKGIYSKHFTAESLCHCHLLIYHIYQNNWIACSRYLTILWPNSGLERLFFPFQKLKRRSAAELSIFYITAFFCWSSLFSMHDFNTKFFLSLVILAEISLHLKITQEQYHLS
jgi:hypothetical protein